MASRDTIGDGGHATRHTPSIAAPTAPQCVAQNQQKLDMKMLACVARRSRSLGPTHVSPPREW